jgi:type IV secretory pathway VirB10-like protein
MSEEVRLPGVSRRRLFWLAAAATAIAAPVIMLPMSDARAQSDQAPTTEPTAAKKTKSKSDKTKKKTKPADTMAPAANPPAAPKQQ